MTVSETVSLRDVGLCYDSLPHGTGVAMESSNGVVPP